VDTVRLGSIGVAYTYPTLDVVEFILAAAKEVQKAGLKNVLVTNGFYPPEPFRQLLPYIDALNIDVKGFTGEFYQRWSKGNLLPF
jgi:pyruvate formate lyase activating enzyme